MKVLIVNGSPKTNGGTHISCEIARGVLNKNGIETEIVNLGKGTVNDCIGCGACRKTGSCVFGKDDGVNEFIEKAKTAVALSYMPGDAAPKILATGKGAIAERIIETAKEADVPTYKDDKLADTLSRLEIGDMIPPELYEVVAEILVFVNDMDKIRSKLGK